MLCWESDSGVCLRRVSVAVVSWELVLLEILLAVLGFGRIWLGMELRCPFGEEFDCESRSGVRFWIRWCLVGKDTDEFVICLNSFESFRSMGILGFDVSHATFQHKIE